MYALLQRVRSARVEVHGAVVGQIAQGLLVLPNARKASAFRPRMDSAGRVSGHGPEGGCLNLGVSRRQAKI